MKRKTIISIISIAAVLTMSIGLTGSVFADEYETRPISGYLSGTNYELTEVHYNNLMDVVVSSDDGSCNLRTGAGTNYSLITPIYNGTTLYITAVNQSSYDGLVWGQTTYNGYTGWVSLKLTTVTCIENSSRAEYDVKVTTPDYISIRKGPGTEYDQLFKPSNGQVLRITQTATNAFDGRPWGLTYYNGTYGWVSLNWTERVNVTEYNKSADVVFFNNVFQATVSASDGYLNLRTGPSINNQIITSIGNGNTLKVTAVCNNSSDGLVWGLTNYNGNQGWISMSQTTISSIDNASTHAYNVKVTNSSNVKLRKGPGTEYGELISYIGNGTTLYITQTVINSFDGRPWGLTYYNGTYGWVSLSWTYRAPGV